ncbi:MAG: radical SAM family heme chaperone HemW [Kiritimatiellia bacterium]
MIPHLYIHIPFCSSKCFYCVFYSETGIGRNEVSEYPSLLGKELTLNTQLFPPLQPQTIYIGGGTPSLLGAEGFAKLTEQLEKFVNPKTLEEWSVEINPSSASAELFETMHRCGVSRLTFGAQSFNNPILETVNRNHNAQCAVEAVKSAAEHGFSNIGIDLIAGLPGTTAKSWRKDMKTALLLNPKHISIYALTVEKGTPLAAMNSNGLLLPSEEELMDRIREGETILTAEGFIRYEISNYALPGYECRHNLGIWRGNDYMGIGPAAASRIKLKRQENIPDFRRWRNALGRNHLPPRLSGILSPKDDALERVLFRMRLNEGFSVTDCLKEYPLLKTREQRWQKTLEHLAESNAVEKNGDSWRLTQRGREVCDYVIRELI